MRLLVLDESRILVSVVRRIAPSCVDVETVETFEAAWRVLQDRTPDAVIANVGPSDLPWDAIRNYCQKHDPKIPILFESCIHRSPAEAGLGPLNHNAVFLQKPYPLDELKTQLDRLVRTALETQGRLDPCDAVDDLLAGDEPPHHGPHLDK